MDFVIVIQTSHCECTLDYYKCDQKDDIISKWCADGSIDLGTYPAKLEYVKYTYKTPLYSRFIVSYRMFSSSKQSLLWLLCQSYFVPHFVPHLSH